MASISHTTYPNGELSTNHQHPADGTTLIALRGVTKRFGPVQALSDIDLDIRSGMVTALAGDNGAGKTVLIKTIAGLWEPDEGQILWEGQPVRMRTPKEAEDLGITTIYQDLALCDNLDVVQKMEVSSRGTLSDLSVTSLRSIRQPVGSLSGGQRQSVAVARAVMAQAKLVIMDEPTAALGVAQTRMVLDLVRSLKGEGVTVILISHNLNDVFAVADRIAILHLGRLVDYMTTGHSARSATSAVTA